MGYDLPAAIGAAFARRGAGAVRRRRVICLAGDGSIQMNLQELQTIVQHQLPVKIFVFNNDGYLSIRQTQDNLFGGRRVGEGPGSGVTFPDMVARRRRLRHRRRAGSTATTSSTTAIAATLVAATGPALVDVVMDPDQTFAPKVIAERLPDGRMVSQAAGGHVPVPRPRGVRREHDRCRCTHPERGEPMNELERKMVEQLQDLRENHHVIGVKAEFEAEGTRLEEAMRLKEVITAAGLGLTMKVGGCEAAARHVRGARHRRRAHRRPDGRVAVGAAQVRRWP